jgi:hypothetical protein
VAEVPMTRPQLDRSSRQQRHTMFMSLLILTVLSLPLILASCGTTAGKGSLLSTEHAATQTPVSVSCLPASKGAMPRCSTCPPAQGQQPARFPCTPCPPEPLTAPPTCFPCSSDKEAPCPIVSPQPTPHLGQPVIDFCQNPPAPAKSASGTIQLQGFVCGRSFHPTELVTIAANGRSGRFEWQVRADQAGAFESSLPPLLCRLVPLTLTASGNQGSRSNSLTLEADACPPAV